jgi:hypothetical protein
MNMSPIPLDSGWAQAGIGSLPVLGGLYMYLRARRQTRDKRIEDRAAERAREDLRHAAIDARLQEHEGRLAATDAGIAGVRQELVHQTNAITSRLDQLILAFLGRSEIPNHPHQ